MMQEKHDRTRQLEGFLNQAGARISQARQCRDQGRHAAAVQDCQQAIELLAKCVFLVRGRPYPPEHVIPEDAFLAAITGLPEAANPLNLPRLYLLHVFWAEFYSKARYGLEKLTTPPEDIFRYGESELALAHANECQGVILRLRTIVSSP